MMDITTKQPIIIPTIAGHLQYASLMHEFQDENVFAVFEMSLPRSRRRVIGGAIMIDVLVRFCGVVPGCFQLLDSTARVKWWLVVRMRGMPVVLVPVAIDRVLSQRMW